MIEKFFEQKVEYFWEYDYSFGEQFLKTIFPKQYRRKYSLTGNGIYNLIDGEDGHLYEIKFSKAKSMVENDSILSRSAVQNVIATFITTNLKTEYTISKHKYITFKLGSDIAKIEIIKKIKEPT